MITWLLQCVSLEVINLPNYDGLNDVDIFLDAFEREILENQRFQALDWVLRAMPARWWGTHKGSFDNWHECRRMMRTRFGKLKLQMIDKYDGQDDPHAHLAKWTQDYGEKLQLEWVHLFYHIMDVVPMNWYVET